MLSDKMRNIVYAFLECEDLKQSPGQRKPVSRQAIDLTSDLSVFFCECDTIKEQVMTYCMGTVLMMVCILFLLRMRGIADAVFSQKDKKETMAARRDRS